MPRIGFFNDNARDAVKGAEVYGHISNGYVSGAPLEDQIAKSLLGSRGFVTTSCLVRSSTISKRMTTTI